MQTALWFGSSRRVVEMLASIMLATALALCGLAWRMVELDRAVAGQRLRDRLEQAADRGSSALLRHRVDLEADLGRLVENPDARIGQNSSSVLQLDQDAILVLFTGSGLQIWPHRPLRYRPLSVPASLVAQFSAAEDLEFRLQDYRRAARAFHTLSESADPGVRAESLLRAARNERKAGQTRAALTTYAQLAGMGARLVQGEPAELVARHARLSLLPDTLRRQEADAIWRDLDTGRWLLSRTSFEFYAGELGRAMPVAI